jgi:hypothetical protein
MSERTICIMVGDRIYSAKPFPPHIPNPTKFRWWVWRNGVPVGGAKNKKDFEAKAKSGWWDSAQR